MQSLVAEISLTTVVWLAIRISMRTHSISWAIPGIKAKSLEPFELPASVNFATTAIEHSAMTVLQDSCGTVICANQKFCVDSVMHGIYLETLVSNDRFSLAFFPSPEPMKISHEPRFEFSAKFPHST